MMLHRQAANSNGKQLGTGTFNPGVLVTHHIPNPLTFQLSESLLNHLTDDEN